MSIKSTSLEINKNIKNWLKEAGRNIVIGIDGYSGAGKTTLLKYLSENNKTILPLFMDDFVSTANTKEKLLPQIESNELGLKLVWEPENGLKNLSSKILDFKSQEGSNQVLVVEGIFLYHPDVLNSVWDKRIYLDTDKDRADERRIVREKERFGKDYFPETHPDSFARLFKIAYKRYEELYKPTEKADLVVQID